MVAISPDIYRILGMTASPQTQQEIARALAEPRANVRPAGEAEDSAPRAEADKAGSAE